MKSSYFPLIFIVFAIFSQAQEFPSDSLISMEEIIIISKTPNLNTQEIKSLGSIDNHLENASTINMIKRGAYAWEPMLQGMSTERSVITLDGMRIFSACTDKMDPVTSYIEVSNFSKVKILTGQSGAEHGGTIAGSIDLIRKRAGFSERKWRKSIFSGYESNNQQKIIGTDWAFSSPAFFTNFDFTYRNAENYKAGKGTEIPFSQFTKYNFSVISGLKLAENQQLEASFIFDKATDVGYPALPMDVSLAQAIIASFQYKYFDLTENFHTWETKIYYNTIEHKMDDSQRPDVPIRMDMPGWSKTFGYYSKLSGNFNQHKINATLSGYFNNSLAEMTMFSNNPNENDMFMLTWPDINTVYNGLFLEDKIIFSSHFNLIFSTGIGWQNTNIKNEMGRESLRIFYPDLEDSQQRILKNINSQAQFHHLNWNFTAGIGYGERSPSVSEAYGFYLFNSSDAYDYVGNPFLKNEKSLDFSLSSQFKSSDFKILWQGNYYRIFDYIVGKTQGNLLPMTIGSNGVKIYESLNYASIFTTFLETEYKVSSWTFTGKLSYRYGNDEFKSPLPLIQPFNYQLGIMYSKRNFSTEIRAEGSSKYSRINKDYGEIPKKEYTLLHWTLNKTFEFENQKLHLNVGVENIFDKNYSTFSDWNTLPRMGRNLFVNLVFDW